jgi:hypothetical protein
MASEGNSKYQKPNSKEAPNSKPANIPDAMTLDLWDSALWDFLGICFFGIWKFAS